MMTLANDPWYASTFAQGLGAAAAYGAVGLILMILGCRLFDLATPKIDVQKELAEKANIAVAIVVASIVLGTAYLLGHIIPA